MWNENGTLELLQSMPKVLSAKNLSDIQQVIDNDKFVNSDKLRAEHCDTYAPFCKNCDKTVEKPCAVAYVRTKIQDGMEVEMEGISADVPVKEGEEGQKNSTKKIKIAVARKK